ncbi:GNAT family N-acetyltransferase [Kitasatospora cathayae]|uniref:GNAT family protein n=1 Tax=Kitasatospora cathayae TaxID=3004092 RepID=A0ABY7Q9J1_9ACTN|nr:GNAT family protein [Kitasatospora sp. HUAS 3-15]WBP89415.1 GNAT family protein [Kitasatospora sp. HUAS 3-15]
MNQEKISLRPIAEADLPQFLTLLNDPDAMGEHLWFGWRQPDRIRRVWAENGLLTDEQWTLAITADGEFCGYAAAMRENATPASWHWSLGAQLLPGARGRGIGTKAHRLFVDYLFAHSPVMRLEAETETGNLAEQRVLEKTGFTREGVQRAQTFRDGEWRDVLLYGLLRTDPRPTPVSEPS